MGAFNTVREAFARDLDTSLRTLGIKIHSAPKGDWQQVLCPLCDDKSGSCSIALKSGYLNCHQCNEKAELFTWYAKWRNIQDNWSACRALAEEIGVVLEPPQRRRGGRPPREMTDDVLEQATQALWDHDQAEPHREFLRKRRLANAEMLMAFGVGYLHGWIVFAQRWPNGTLKKRYRKYAPGANKQSLWSWSSGSGKTQSLWPMVKPPKNAHIWLLEGEWDVLTAWARLRLQDQDIYCYTWTGGAGSPIPTQELPDWIRNRRVDVCYDNDAFQGPDWSTHIAPNQKKRLEMQRRRKAMISTAKGLISNRQCRVFFRAIPVSPEEQYGGDFRDWVDAGGRDLSEIPSWSLDEVIEAEKEKPIECDFQQVFSLAGKQVVFQSVVQTLDQDGLAIPRQSEIDCAMGSETYCNRCRVPEKFNGGVIDWSEYPKELVEALLSRDAEREITRNLLGRPNACSYCRVTPIDYEPGCSWTAVQEDSDEVSDRELIVISEQAPTLSGDIRVHGTVYHHKKSMVVHAGELEMIESQKVDLQQFAGDLQQICPWETNDHEELDDYMTKRANDLAANVTHIYGRRQLHIAADMLPHSCLWMNVDHHVRRGWLDIGTVGDTSTGKSMTFTHLFNYHGLGKIHACMENVSRAGLTMGGVTGEKTKVKPGLFPRSHKKMLVLDEFHIMVEEGSENPMLHLQSARDLGHVGGVKIYGSRQLPSAVRLATISNWAHGRPDSFKFPCEHLLYLYGKPEALRRLDYGIVVMGEPEETEVIEAPHQWTRELMQALILRAWQQDTSQVRIDDAALKFARKKVQEWGTFYADELPLFTGAEKTYSMLRIAVAVANMSFSRAKDDIYSCHVREAHVRWAANWLTEVWEASRYEAYSHSQISKREVKQPFHVEAHFTVKLGVTDAHQALRLLDNFFGLLTMQEIAAYVGKDHYEATKWASELVRLGALEKTRAANGYNVEWRLTKGAHLLLKNLLVLASEFEHEFAWRVNRLGTWFMGGAREDPDMMTLTTPTEHLRHEWETNGHGETDIHSGPWGKTTPL